MYPYYQSLSTEDKEIYVNICTAIETFDYAMDFGKFDTYKEAREMKNKAVEIYSALIYEQPQYFWIDPYGCRYSIVEEKGNKFTFYATGILSPKEAKEKKEIFDKKVSEIVSEAKAKADAYSQILYVHDEILNNTSYDYELSKEINKSNQNIFTAYLSDDEPQHTTDIKQTAYGCLIDGKTILGQVACRTHANTLSLLASRRTIGAPISLLQSAKLFSRSVLSFLYISCCGAFSTRSMRSFSKNCKRW